MSNNIRRVNDTGCAVIYQSTWLPNNATVVRDTACFPVKEAMALCRAAVTYHLTGPGHPNISRVIDRYELAADKYIAAVSRMREKAKSCKQ